MDVKFFSYSTEEEAQKIKSEQAEKGYKLVEVQNITEGDFLGFVSTDWIPPAPATPESERLRELEKELAVANEKVDKLTSADLDNKALLNELGAMIAVIAGT